MRFWFQNGCAGSGTSLNFKRKRREASLSRENLDFKVKLGKIALLKGGIPLKQEIAGISLTLFPFQVIDHYVYQIYATIISFYGPTVIMVILYVKIWRAAKRIARQDRSLSCNGTDLENHGCENADLLEKKLAEKPDGKRLSGSKLFRSDRKYLHRPSALLHAVKVGLLIN